VSNPWDWPWSSARAHLAAKDDQLVKVAPLLAMIGDWRAFLRSAMPEDELRDIRRHARTGRPLGDEAFLARLEDMVGRVLKPQKRGPKSKEKAN
jgi:putative transposase